MFLPFVFLINKIVEHFISLSLKYGNCFNQLQTVQTVLQIVNIVLQNILIKYVIVQVELNIV